MNYFVVSPNVYNKGEIVSYLNEMKERHIVIMGWSKDDGNTLSNMFVNTVKIGDCIIIARGANWQKQVYYAGIVSSNVIPYTESGESMYRELSHFVELTNELIPFNDKCAYGASRQPVSIYQLKPLYNQADKYVTDSVTSCIFRNISEHINQKNSYSLKEISTWPNKDVSIPGMQRSLVWKPAQVELLWDSILRSFPIGTFTLSETNSTDNSSSYYLMDGQQRFNSIKLAYDLDSVKMKNKEDVNDNDKPILWLDIEPDIPSTSTRRFLVKVTTLAHPWGYNNDDSCTVVSVERKRDILQKLNRNSIYQEPLSPIDCYPVCANKPIPLAWFLSAPTESEEVFCDYMATKLQQTDLPFKRYNIILSSKDTKQLIKKFYPVFQRIKQYRVGTSLITAEALDKNIDDNDGQSHPDALETLFRRIGTGGTQISQEELDYSAIKAYWPTYLKDENDGIANKYMNPERLIRLAFRLALTEPSSVKFKNNISIQQIRIIGDDKGDAFQKIIYWYSPHLGSPLRHTMEIVNDWLTFNGCPKIIRTSIARNSPDVYLLLMFLASKLDNKLDEKQKNLLQGTALYIHWFIKEKHKLEVVNIILKSWNSNSSKPWENRIRAGVGEAVLYGYIPLLLAPESIEIMKEVDSSWNTSFPDKKWWQTWCFISNNREMLLFAEKEYINKHFSAYDPAIRGMWEQHNRPWDMDHIIPKNWIYNKQCRRREYCKYWLWLNGNFAAISFEANRSKSDNPDWREYENNCEELLFDNESKKITNQVTSSDDEAKLFAITTSKRTINIYAQCFSVLHSVIQSISIDENNIALERKVLFLDINKSLRNNNYNSDVRWVDDSSSRREFVIENESEINWLREWISVGFAKNDCYICVCTHDGQKLQIGLRKHFDKRFLDKKSINYEILPKECKYSIINNDWWYIVKEVNAKDITIEEIVDELSLLNKLDL